MNKCTFFGHNWQIFSEAHRRGIIEYRLCLRCHKLERWMWWNDDGEMVNGVSPGRMRWIKMPQYMGEEFALKVKRD